MNFLKEYSITIVSAVLFITLVLMIIPNNNMKKYVKFLLGLILISIFITPIYNLFNKEIDVFSYKSKLDYYFDSSKVSYQEYQDENIKNTEKEFKENLNKLIIEKLGIKYPNYKFTVDTEIDFSSNKFTIKEVNISYKSNKIKKVDKVGGEKMLSQEDKTLLNFISSEFSIDENLIYIKEE